MQTAKFLVTGAARTGKSEFVKSLTEHDGDFGSLQVNDELTIELSTAPLDGDLTDILKNKVGVVLMVDGRDSDTFVNAPQIVTHLRALRHLPVIIAVNKQDLPDAHAPSEVREQFPDSDVIKIFPCVATNKESCEKVLLALIYQILS